MEPPIYCSCSPTEPDPRLLRTRPGARQQSEPSPRTRIPTPWNLKDPEFPPGPVQRGPCPSAQCSRLAASRWGLPSVQVKVRSSPRSSGCMPHIRADRDRPVRELPDFKLTRLQTQKVDPQGTGCQATKIDAVCALLRCPTVPRVHNILAHVVELQGFRDIELACLSSPLRNKLW